MASQLKDLFHPLTTQWFSDTFDAPTDIQEKTWPLIAAGKHVLLTAPTGSGKTLAAFLWAIDAHFNGRWQCGCTNVLYVSPLKALNNDIQRNLLQPLRQLEATFQSAGKNFPLLNVATRSGDTTAAERRRMVRHPPEILITTPESLNILLSSNSGLKMLSSVKTVILDEIHAVLDSKRGVHLISAVDRLVRYIGEFQRIALSATVHPMQLAADFIGGFEHKSSGGYKQRPVKLVESGVQKKLDVRVHWVDLPQSHMPGDSVWPHLAAHFREIIQRNRSTIFFARKRSLCEQLVQLINEGMPAPLAYAHHGSLSREIRYEVEQRLKNGKLRAIVATNSLELGIDIGELDEVVMVQSPASVSAALQRAGRSGHRVGAISRTELVPTHNQDLLEAALLAREMAARRIETTRTVDAPLDVLAQVLTSMVAVEERSIESLYCEIRSSYPYRNLSRRLFDLVLEMLAGRYADTRMRELQPRISLDRIEGTVRIAKGALQTLYMSGGTIPDRGYYKLRRADSNAFIGELDEEFVWEAKPGQVFAFGTQRWQIASITHNDVFVCPAPPSAAEAPFWRGETLSREFAYSENIAEFLEEADAKLGTASFKQRLKDEFFLNDSAAEKLVSYLQLQKERTGCSLPHRHHLLLEQVEAAPDGTIEGSHLIIHTGWGGTVNRPYALALQAAWQQHFGEVPEIYTSDDAVFVQLAAEIEPEEILRLVRQDNLEQLLHASLSDSGFFGARFRECAGRALLLPRRDPSHRTPLWLTRLRSQKLLQKVATLPDFPMVIETWRTCLADEFNLPALEMLLNELETGQIKWSFLHRFAPSPFAQGTVWNQINAYMYRDDTPKAGSTTKVAQDLIREAVFAEHMRPTLNPELLVEFVKKRQRLQQGYCPSSGPELLDWVKERVCLRQREWQELLGIMRTESSEMVDSALQQVGAKLVKLKTRSMAEPVIAALEQLPELQQILPHKLDAELLSGKKVSSARKQSEIVKDYEIDNVVAQWLQFYGPVKANFIAETFGLQQRECLTLLEDLLETDAIVSGQLVEGSGEDFVCDSENLEILLRMQRRRAQPVVIPKPIAEFAEILADLQFPDDDSTEINRIVEVLDQLTGYSAKAEAWEQDILPARIHDYHPELLDAALPKAAILWLGRPKKQICFCSLDDLDLVNPVDSIPDELPQKLGFAHKTEHFSFVELSRNSPMSTSELAKNLWQTVWRGTLSNNSFAALRQGVTSKFKPPAEIGTEEPTFLRRRRRRRTQPRFNEWKSALPFSGNWFLIPPVQESEDLLEEEEKQKERVRILLGRYGIVFKELLEHEPPEFHWRSLFRAMRIMELGGEIFAGHFLTDVSGLQFASREAVQKFVAAERDDKPRIFWLCATDPASLCGLPCESLRKLPMPPRVPGAYVVYRGNELVLTMRQHGKQLHVAVPPEDLDLPQFYAPLHHLLNRAFQCKRSLSVAQINDLPVRESPYVSSLKEEFEAVMGPRQLVLYRKIN